LALAAAQDYVSGAGDAKVVEKVREDCWAYVDKVGPSTVDPRPETPAVRAVICCLFTEVPKQDLVDILLWFAFCARKMETESTDQQEILARMAHFATGIEL
jgi:hypothetical protein